jgi:hypothetical protein
MPWGAAVGTNGLKSCVIELSGELSITSVFVAPLVLPEPVAEPELEEEPEEQAASPAASRPTAATATARLLVADLVVNIDFPL